MPDDTTEARDVLAKGMRQAYHGRRILPDWSTVDRWDKEPWLEAADVALVYAATARQSAIEEAARVCEEQQAVFASDEYAVGQPSSSWGERFACGQCAAAIRQLGFSGEEAK